MRVLLAGPDLEENLSLGFLVASLLVIPDRRPDTRLDTRVFIDQGGMIEAPPPPMDASVNRG